jgi:hypothetical protein
MNDSRSPEAEVEDEMMLVMMIEGKGREGRVDEDFVSECKGMGRGRAKRRQNGCSLELKVMTYQKLKVSSARGTLDARRRRFKML